LLLKERIEAHSGRKLVHVVHKTGIERGLLELLLLRILGYELVWEIVGPQCLV